MMPLGQMEIKDSEIKSGDVVRLQKQFRPEYFRSQAYSYAIVAGVVADELRRRKTQQSISDDKPTAAGCQPRVSELIVYLYEPDSSSIYRDPLGVKALFSFGADEVKRDNDL